MSQSDRRLVYSTDPKDIIRCPRCSQFKDECRCVTEVDPNTTNFTVKFRIEKNGRGGKTVTVMADWPWNESYLKEMTKTLKARCGSGGTYKNEAGKGVIEIQGDHRESIKKYFDLQKIRHKGQ